MNALACSRVSSSLPSLTSCADSDMAKVFEIAEALRGEGKSVRAERGESTAQRCGQLLKVSKEGVEALEAND